MTQISLFGYSFIGNDAFSIIIGSRYQGGDISERETVFEEC